MEALKQEARVAVHGQETAIADELWRRDQRHEGIHEGIRDRLTMEHHDTQKLRAEHRKTREVIQAYIPKEIETQVATALNRRIEEFFRLRPSWDPSTRSPSEEGTQTPYRLNRGG